MEPIWNYKIFTVRTNRLVKYLEINIYQSSSIKFSYVCENSQHFVEVEKYDNFSLDKLDKFKTICLNFPHLEVQELDTNKFIDFFIKISKNI